MCVCVCVCVCVSIYMCECSCRLTLVLSSNSDLSSLESFLHLLVALERGSVETEGALPVDHTSTIKSVRAYLN